MNEQIQQQIAILLGNLNAALTTSGHFIADQLPAALIGYIHYGIMINSIWVALCFIVLSCFLLITLRYGWFNYKAVDKDGGWYDVRTFSCFFGSIASVCMSIIFVYNIGQLLLVIYSPQVWMIQQVVKLSIKN